MKTWNHAYSKTYILTESNGLIAVDTRELESAVLNKDFTND